MGVLASAGTLYYTYNTNSEESVISINDYKDTRNAELEQQLVLKMFLTSIFLEQHLMIPKQKNTLLQEMEQGMLHLTMTIISTLMI